jgi:thiosulfate/3-mercaptopyruvate sulfurtransferase
MTIFYADTMKKESILPLISSQELVGFPSTSELIIIHAGGGREAYQEKHIAGARYLDPEGDLSDIKPDAAQGGRHPLPTAAAFGKTIAKAGISPETHVVTYDDKSGANAAARFWWMMRSIGHEKVQVLNGGLQAAEKAGMPIDSEEVEFEPVSSYPVNEWQWPVATMEEVESAAIDYNQVVVDVRDAYRYKGESEPIDPVAGHIPGAVNIPFSENLDEDGFFLSGNEIREKYGPLLEDYKAVIHCGSGVTACHTILALVEAGFDIPKLYVGSWSEWCRNDKPIGKAI